MDDLVKRGGLYYKQFTDVPFTGKVTGIEQGSIKDGKRDGAWIAYRENGTVDKEKTGTFKNGKKISD
tara:strand:- start:558 stop:758 length:201 start_codon:yes stop_codon:yes gene_type:complete